MTGFKISCGNCGSDKIVEKSAHNLLGQSGERSIYGEGIQRKCLNCGNEDFSLLKTRLT
ncbi:hypothetical protein OXPF_18920 [Oxobacter pfennigii]|uniref:Uncharacterized protein n=1 Tax=Oxobacter pfennigii TaxID=36849 RepID=A0A0P8YCD3_9CLOT|nr:hypothetical protein [Oxobacter pfennigii]KPU44806.1 hypothetical protein OXPF_18920 [Oxobacter pfennigii]